MKSPLFRSDMDRGQCQNPHCTHEDHAELSLNPRCHLGNALACSIDAGVLSVRCATCGKGVARIAVEDAEIEVCHDGGVSCWYKDGHLRLLCSICESPVAKLVVRERQQTDEPVQLHRMTCAACNKPITKGQPYANVRLPDGGTTTIHGSCFNKPRKEPSP